MSLRIKWSQTGAALLLACVDMDRLVTSPCASARHKLHVLLCRFCCLLLVVQGPGHLQLQRYQQQPPSASQHAAQLRQLQQERERRVGDDGRPIVRDYGAPAASGTGALRCSAW